MTELIVSCSCPFFLSHFLYCEKLQIFQADADSLYILNHVRLSILLWLSVRLKERRRWRATTPCCVLQVSVCTSKLGLLVSRFLWRKSLHVIMHQTFIRKPAHISTNGCFCYQMVQLRRKSLSICLKCLWRGQLERPSLSWVGDTTLRLLVAPGGPWRYRYLV